MSRKLYSKLSQRRLPSSILAFLQTRVHTRRVDMPARTLATADLPLLDHGLDQVILHQARRLQGRSDSLSK